MAVEGYIESVSKYQLRGWAYSATSPSAHLEVFAESEGALITKGVANLFREDLARARVAAGDHAYVLNLEKPLSDEELAKLKIYVVDEAGVKRFLSAPKVAKSAAPAPPLKPHFAPVDETQFPVFVLGAARSGTSALAQALVRSGWLEGHEEGHLLPLLPRLLRTVHEFYNDNGEEAEGVRSTLLSVAPKAFFLSSVRSLFPRLTRQTYPSGRWVDKTPKVEMVALTPILREVWPNSRFLFVRRRGLENIASRIRKFPQVTFSDHCTDWASVMKTWLDVRGRLGPAMIEIEHLDLARNPTSVANAIAMHIGMPPDASASLTQALSFDRPERSSSVFAEVLDFEALDWTAQQKEEFVGTCGPMMAKYDYTLDLDYQNVG